MTIFFPVVFAQQDIFLAIAQPFSPLPEEK